MVFKCLTPEHIVITQGFRVIDPCIKLRIADIAINQILDLDRRQRYQDKVSGMDHIFIAPEVRYQNVCTSKADTWSVGIILYLMITGGIEQQRNNNMMYSMMSSPGMSTTGLDDYVFDFQEPQWANFSSEVKDFVKACLEIDHA